MRLAHVHTHTHVHAHICCKRREKAGRQHRERWAAEVALIVVALKEYQLTPTHPSLRYTQEQDGCTQRWSRNKAAVDLRHQAAPAPAGTLTGCWI